MYDKFYFEFRILQVFILGEQDIFQYKRQNCFYMMPLLKKWMKKELNLKRRMGLYQYKTKMLHLKMKHFADRTGLEPATSAVTGRHSNQLNYRSVPRFLECKYKGK